MVYWFYLLIWNRDGYLIDFLPPYAFIFHTQTGKIETLENAPLLSDAQFDKDDKNILWGITYDGQIIKYSIDKDEIISVFDLNIKNFEKDERENVHVLSFERSE